MSKETNETFITDDIIINDWDNDDFERYEYPKKELDKRQYPEHKEKTDNEFNEWSEEYLSFEELYDVPMMSSIRYYPKFIEFNLDEDNKKCSSATCLIYDRKIKRYGVAMSGGGMDLTPNLLETFFNLKKGVPVDLAVSLDTRYSAYLDKEIHIQRCNVVGKALVRYANQMIIKAEELQVI